MPIAPMGFAYGTYRSYRTYGSHFQKKPGTFCRKLPGERIEMDRRTCVLMLVLSFLVSLAATGKAAQSPVATASLFDQPPKIDGAIGPDEWWGAVQVTGVRSQRARPRWKALEDRMATVYCGYTKERLYVAMVSELPPNQRLDSQRRGRDSDKMVFDPSVEIWTCPYRQTAEGAKVGEDYFQFIVNSNGNILDNAFFGGKPDPGWNADWEIANKLHKEVEEGPAWMKKNGVWVCEISVPFSDFGVEGSPVGRTVGLLIARNWHGGTWDQAPWFPLPGRSWTDPTNYAPIKLTGNAPTVQIKDLGPKVFDGQLELKTEIYNPGPARKAVVDLQLESSDMPGLSDKKTLDLPAGETVQYAYSIPPERFHKIANHSGRFLVKAPDSDITYMDWKVWWSQASENPWPGIKTGPQPQKAVRLAYYPSYKFIRVGVNTMYLGKEGEGARSATVVVTDEEGEQLLRETMQWEGEGSEAEFEVGKLPDGEYTAAITVEGEDYERTFERTFRREHFVWEGNRLGITDRVYPPFKPIEVEGDEISVVMRDYAVGGLGLWKSVRARGNESPHKELLASPARLRANGEVLEGEGDFTTTADHEAVYEGRATHPAVTVETKATTEYDGCQRVELTLKPGPSTAVDGNRSQSTALDSLSLEIPVRDAIAPLFHVCSTSIRRNPAGFTPEGRGRIWDSRDYPDGEWIGNFKAYIWVGGEERGICFFADNDRNWVLQLGEEEGAQEVPCQELIRRDGVLTLRINFVQKPLTIEEPRTIVFGLMASPAKPMPENWRNILLSNQWHYSGKLPGYRTLEWGGSTYWGAAETMKETYPLNRDMSILNKIQEARLRASRAGMQEFVRAWEQRNLSDYEPRGRKNPEQVLGLVRHSIRRSASTHADFQSWYWEEFHSVSRHHPETQVFGNEWSGGYRKGSVHPLAPSYLDFQCWYGAEFIRRGIGLYFDNTYPKQAHDPLTTAAYRRPDGRIQASASMWRHREYFKRIWVLHQQLAQPEKKPVMMFHMTNSHVVPYMSFGQTNLDLEWRYSKEQFQPRFSPELLRTQSLGLQTGNVPFALASERGAPGRMGGLMIHEVRCWFIKRNAMLMQKLLEFGYGREDCRVINYWDDDPPLSLSDDQCRWLLLERDGKLMVLLCTWNENESELSVKIDTDALGVDVSQAFNVEDGEPVQAAGGDFRFRMPGYGTRIFRIE